MSFIKRYRRITMTRSRKPFAPVFVISADEVIDSLTGGRL